MSLQHSGTNKGELRLIDPTSGVTLKTIVIPSAATCLAQIQRESMDLEELPMLSRFDSTLAVGTRGAHIFLLDIQFDIEVAEVPQKSCAATH